jgi:hypothetical protein
MNTTTSNGRISVYGKESGATLKGLAALMEQLQKEAQGPFQTEENPQVISSNATRTIIIPDSLTKRQAAEELWRQADNEEQMIDTDADFEGWYWKDVLVAVKHVSEKMFGYIDGGWGATEIDIIVDLVDGKAITTKAFYGNFRIAAFEHASASISIDKKGVTRASISSAKKFGNYITEYFNAIREYLAEHSIFRGRSISIKKHAQWGLEFEIFENKKSDTILLNHDERVLLDSFVLNRLGRKDKTGKRTYLFCGDYGNGKTESAKEVGRIAVERGLSFFYLRDTSVFAEALLMLKRYQPCLLFVEDVDEIGSGEKRDEAMNKLLNTLDGVETKGNTLTVIFTTNHQKRINKALRRPGRIDLIIPFNNPTKETKAAILRHYLQLHVDPRQGELNYDYLAGRIDDVQGAVVAEICKRAVELADGQHVTQDIVEAATLSLQYQVELMKEQPEAPNKTEVDVVKAFFNLVSCPE